MTLVPQATGFGEDFFFFLLLWRWLLRGGRREGERESLRPRVASRIRPGEFAALFAASYCIIKERK